VAGVKNFLLDLDVYVHQHYSFYIAHASENLIKF